MDAWKERIKELKNQIKDDYEKIVLPKRKELYGLMDDAARSICPYKTGDIVVIDGRKAIIEDIHAFSQDFAMKTFDAAYMIGVDLGHDGVQAQFTFTWAISGHYLKKDDSVSKWSFDDISRSNYDFKDEIVTTKSLESFLGIDEYFKIDE